MLEEDVCKANGALVVPEAEVDSREARDGGDLVEVGANLSPGCFVGSELFEGGLGS